MPFREIASRGRLSPWNCRYHAGWLLLSTALVVAAWAWQARSEAEVLSRSFARLEAAAAGASSTIGSTFEAVDGLLSLAQTAEALEQAGNQAGAEAVLAHLRGSASAGRFASPQVALIGADGWLRWSSVPNTPAIWLGDRPYVQRRLRDRLPGVEIHAPGMSRTSGRRIVQVTRLLTDAQGALTGLAAVALDPAALDVMLTAAAGEASIRMRLYRAGDGLDLTGDDEGAGPAPELAAAAQARFADDVQLPDAGGWQLTSWRRLPERPVIVAATMPRADALREVRRLRWQLWAGVAVAIAMGFAAAAALHANAALRRASLLDPLTGLPGRRALPRALRRCLSLQAARGDAGLALLLVDIDRFRAINDSYGLLIGDAVLRAVASRLRQAVRPDDSVLRLGADEFVVLLAGLRTAEDAVRAARRLSDALARPLDVEARGLRITACVGLALAPIHGSSAEQLLRHADIALGHAKSAAPGQVCHFASGMEQALRARQEMEQALRLALEREELELHFQPLFDLSRWEVCGFEALARWHRPGIGFVSPAEFIPVAEQSGLILPLGRWVLREAMRHAITWPGTLKVAVNLSPVQFTDSDLPAEVAQALGESGLAPARLELEITEGVLLRDTEETLRSLQALRGLGARVALDDFGTGYASLSYLLRFPFDKVKIDRAFVGALGTGGDGTEIVRAVIGMCRSLHIATCAEGVETPEQLRRLQAEGCSEAQGYLLSTPRPAGEVPAMLEELSRRLTLAA